MDADDISCPSRIQDELLYLQNNHLDMVGSYIETIDENGKTIKSLMRFPINHNQIVKFMRWGKLYLSSYVASKNEKFVLNYKDTAKHHIVKIMILFFGQ